MCISRAEPRGGAGRGHSTRTKTACEGSVLLRGLGAVSFASRKANQSEPKDFVLDDVSQDNSQGEPRKGVWGYVEVPGKNSG